MNTFVTVKGKDDFAVAAGLEIIFSGVLCTNIPMVVRFLRSRRGFVSGRDYIGVALRFEGLRWRGVHGPGWQSRYVDAAPVRPAMAELL